MLETGVKHEIIKNTLTTHTRIEERRMKKRRKLEAKRRLIPTPHSRYIHLPMENALAILKTIRKFLTTRVTDKWLHLERQQLLSKHANTSDESIDELLYSTFKDETRFKGKDLMEHISRLYNESMVDVTNVRDFVVIGTQYLGKLVKQGVQFHCILCDKPNLAAHMVYGDLVGIPVIVLPGLTDVVLEFTEWKEKFCETLAFNVVEGNPFYELVKMIGLNLPDDVDVSGSIQACSNGVMELNEEEVDNEDDDDDAVENVSNDDKVETDIPLKTSFTDSLPQITVENQRLILEEMQAVFEHISPHFQLAGHIIKMKEQTCKPANANLLDETAIEKLLYANMLCHQGFVGVNICNLLSAPRTPVRSQCIVSLASQMYQHVKNGEEFHFILYCSSAAEYINNDTQFQEFASTIPLFAVEGLRLRLKNGYRLVKAKGGGIPVPPIIAFKKTQDNPLDDLVKFINSKLP